MNRKKYTDEELEYMCVFFKQLIKEKGKAYIPAFKTIFEEDLPKEVIDYVLDDTPLPI